MADTHPAVSVSLSYRDPKAAIRFLEAAFGFEPEMILLTADDEVAHSELRFGEGVVMVGTEWSERHRSPSRQGGINTQSVHLQLDRARHGELDAHCERARAAGARILQEPDTQFYGDRTYRAEDPEGHIWTVAQTVTVTTPEDWERSTGLRTVKRL